MAQPSAKRARQEIVVQNVPSGISDYLTYDVETSEGRAGLVGHLRAMTLDEYLSLCIAMLTYKEPGTALTHCPLSLMQNITGIRTIYDIKYVEEEELITAEHRAQDGSWVVAQLSASFCHVATFWETKPIQNQKRAAVFKFQDSMTVEECLAKFTLVSQTLSTLDLEAESVAVNGYSVPIHLVSFVIQRFKQHLDRVLTGKPYEFAMIDENILTIYDHDIEQHFKVILKVLETPHPDFRGALSRIQYPQKKRAYYDGYVDVEKPPFDLEQMKSEIEKRLEENSAFIELVYFNTHIAAIMVTRGEADEQACFHCGFAGKCALPAWTLAFKKKELFKYPAPQMHKGAEGRCVLTAFHCALHFLKTLLDTKAPKARYTDAWIPKDLPSSLMLPQGFLEVMLADIPISDQKTIIVKSETTEPYQLIQEARQHMHSLLQNLADCTISEEEFPTQIISIGGKSLQKHGLKRYVHCTISVPFLDLAVSR